jgi:hypothetical protein
MKKTKFTLIVAFVFATVITKAQTIPNAGFEMWTSMGSYSDPDSWTTHNAATSSASTYTAEQGTPGSPGSAYLKLTSKMVTGMGIMNGTADSKFAYNVRSQNFTGKWQHMIYGSSQGSVDIQLTRWDMATHARVTVASGQVTLSGMAMSWANFSVPLTYMDNANNPDSCMITFAASGMNPTANDYLWVDNLAFTGTVAIVSGINDVTNSNVNVAVSPNPSSFIWNVSIQTTEKVSLTLFNVLGKQIEMVQPINPTEPIKINNENLSSGIYFLQIANSDKTKTIKLIKN